MAVENPPSVLAAGSYSANMFRRLFDALSGGTGGAVGASELLVTETAAGAALSVDVSPGRAFVVGSESAYQASYFVDARFVETLVISTPDLLSPRIDLVVARVKDSGESGALDEWSLEVVAGVPATFPLTPSAPANSLTLASVLVPAGALSIVDSNIAQLTPVWTGLLVGSFRVTDGAVVESKLADDAVGSAALAADAVVADGLASGAVDSAALAADAVGTAELADGAVDSAAILNGAVDSSLIATGAVTAGKIAADAVDTAEIVDGAVTVAKLASPVSFTSLAVPGITLDGTDLGEVTSFTPAFTTDWSGVSWTSAVGYYAYLKDMVVVTYEFEYLSGNSNDDTELTLPVTALSEDEVVANFRGVYSDVSTGIMYPLIGAQVDADTVKAQIMYDAQAGTVIGNLNNAFDTGRPVSWGAGDLVSINLAYRVA